MIGRNVRLTTQYSNGDTNWSMVVDLDDSAIQWAKGYVDEFQGRDVDVEVKPHIEKRSKDANAYFWTLCGQLSAKIGVSPEKIYREYVKDVGGNFSVLCVQEKAADDFIRAWEHQGDGWPCEVFDSKVEGCVNVRAYYGSSTYDKAQMSRLIDLLVEDCKEHGIETMTPEEIRRLIDDIPRD